MLLMLSGALSEMCQIMSRLRNVGVSCGDWSRICGPSYTIHQGLTGVFLDPPYSDKAGRASCLYSVDDLDVAHAVREWCIYNGDSRLMRIALCGYDGEHNELEQHGWRCHSWKACGFFNKNSSNKNPWRERIWFSPHCLDISPKQLKLL